MSFNLDASRKFASEFGWQEIDHQENISMVSFSRDGCRINVYYTKMTVATIVNHPKWGRNQMFRKNVYGDHLRAIFENPRAHLMRDGIPGYHQNGKHIGSIKKKPTPTPGSGGRVGG